MRSELSRSVALYLSKISCTFGMVQLCPGLYRGANLQNTGYGSVACSAYTLLKPTLSDLVWSNPGNAFCADGTQETLTLFACLCPKFREARTSAHNQVRQTITSFLLQTEGPNWTLFEEVRMGQLGLMQRPVSSSRVAHALNRSPDASGRGDDLGSWQPDWVIVSEVHKKPAKVDLCRPADVHQDQLLVAWDRKQRKYTVSSWRLWSITLNKAGWFMPSRC